MSTSRLGLGVQPPIKSALDKIERVSGGYDAAIYSRINPRIGPALSRPGTPNHQHGYFCPKPRKGKN